MMPPIIKWKFTEVQNPLFKREEKFLIYIVIISVHMI